MLKYNLDGKGIFSNLFIDEAFKRAFAQEQSKPFLIAFLNAIFEGKEVINDLEYKPTEIFGPSFNDRKAIYDLLCETKKGYKVLIELQNAKQDYIVNRMQYYGALQLTSQAQRGDAWKYGLKKCYVIVIANFTIFNEYPEYLHHAVSYDPWNHHIISDTVQNIVIETPKLAIKDFSECTTKAEQWCWIIRHAHLLDKKPQHLENTLLGEFFDYIKLVIFTKRELNHYEVDMLTLKEYSNFTDCAFGEGKAKGKAEGIAEGKAEGETKSKIETIKKMLEKKFDWDTITDITGLSEEEYIKLNK